MPERELRRKAGPMEGDAAGWRLASMIASMTRSQSATSLMSVLGEIRPMVLSTDALASASVIFSFFTALPASIVSDPSIAGSQCAAAGSHTPVARSKRRRSAAGL